MISSMLYIKHRGEFRIHSKRTMTWESGIQNDIHYALLGTMKKGVDSKWQSWISSLMEWIENWWLTEMLIPHGSECKVSTFHSMCSWFGEGHKYQFPGSKESSNVCSGQMTQRPLRGARGFSNSKSYKSDFTLFLSCVSTSPGAMYLSNKAKHLGLLCRVAKCNGVISSKSFFIQFALRASKSFIKR